MSFRMGVESILLGFRLVQIPKNCMGYNFSESLFQNLNGLNPAHVTF